MQNDDERIHLVLCSTPHQFIRSAMKGNCTGKIEDSQDARSTVLIVVKMFPVLADQARNRFFS